LFSARALKCYVIMRLEGPCQARWFVKYFGHSNTPLFFT